MVDDIIGKRRDYMVEQTKQRQQNIRDLNETRRVILQDREEIDTRKTALVRQTDGAEGVAKMDVLSGQFEIGRLDPFITVIGDTNGYEKGGPSRDGLAAFFLS